MDIYLDASRLGIYPPLFTSPWKKHSCILSSTRFCIDSNEGICVVNLIKDGETGQETKLLQTHDHKKSSPVDWPLTNYRSLLFEVAMNGDLTIREYSLGRDDAKSIFFLFL